MDTLDALQRQVEAAHQLSLVVRVMKSLAAASIRQFERAAQAMDEFREAVELALTVALRDVDLGAEREFRTTGVGRGAIVIGSDQGMCGAFNDHVAGHALVALHETESLEEKGRPPVVLAIGSRAAARLSDVGLVAAEILRPPTSADGIAALVQDLLVRLDAMRSRGVGTVLVVFNQHVAGAGFEPHHLRLLPFDRAWAATIQARPWPSHLQPIFTDARPRFLGSILSQHLFSTLHLALASSLASEHASRLASMQAAQRNIEERVASLQGSLRKRRQDDIDAELMDIMAGFEAISEEPGG